MTKRVGDVIIIESTAAAVCDLCGKTDELRPYGPNGEDICFDCGMKDEKTTTKQMNKLLFDEES